MSRIIIAFLVTAFACSNLYAFDIDQYKDYPKLHTILKRELTRENFLKSPAGIIAARRYNLNKNYLARYPRSINNRLANSRQFNNKQPKNNRVDNSYSVYRDEYDGINYAFDAAYKEWEEVRGSKIVQYVLPLLLTL